MTIQQLEQKLSNLKQRFHLETTFDSNYLEQQKINNRGYVRKHEEFKFEILGLLILKTMELSSKGWTFDLRNPASKSIYGSYSCVFNKPESMVQQEYADSDAKTEADYIQSLQSKKIELIESIARIEVALKEAIAAEKSQSKRQSDFEKALEKVKAELLTEVEGVE